MAILDRVETQEAIEAAKAEILAALAKTDGKLDVGVMANTIRNIQRGVITKFNENAEHKKITAKVSLAGFVDASKMFVLVNGSMQDDARENYARLPYVDTVTKDYIEVAYHTGYTYESSNVSYQVIEFF